jgi:subtilase family serine protease
MSMRTLVFSLVISQSFGAGEGSFHNGLAAINQLRQAFVDAQANHVTVFASSGDGGTTNPYKEPVKNPATITYPSIIWPAADPLSRRSAGRTSASMLIPG